MTHWPDGGGLRLELRCRECGTTFIPTKQDLAQGPSAAEPFGPQICSRCKKVLQDGRLPRRRTPGDRVT